MRNKTRIETTPCPPPPTRVHSFIPLCPPTCGGGLWLVCDGSSLRLLSPAPAWAPPTGDNSLRKNLLQHELCRGHSSFRDYLPALDPPACRLGISAPAPRAPPPAPPSGTWLCSQGTLSLIFPSALCRFCPFWNTLSQGHHRLRWRAQLGLWWGLLQSRWAPVGISRGSASLSSQRLPQCRCPRLGRDILRLASVRKGRMKTQVRVGFYRVWGFF